MKEKRDSDETLLYSLGIYVLFIVGTFVFYQIGKFLKPFAMGFNSTTISPSFLSFLVLLIIPFGIILLIMFIMQHNHNNQIDIENLEENLEKLKEKCETDSKKIELKK